MPVVGLFVAPGADADDCFRYGLAVSVDFRLRTVSNVTDEFHVGRRPQARHTQTAWHPMLNALFREMTGHSSEALPHALECVR